MNHTCLFFFSSRRRHTRYWRDWSSDVCSSDLRKHGEEGDLPGDVGGNDVGNDGPVDDALDLGAGQVGTLQELRDAELPQLDRRVVLEDGARPSERGAHSGDDGHATAAVARRCHGRKLTVAPTEAASGNRWTRCSDEPASVVLPTSPQCRDPHHGTTV